MYKFAYLNNSPWTYIRQDINCCKGEDQPNIKGLENRKLDKKDVNIFLFWDHKNC